MVSLGIGYVTRYIDEDRPPAFILMDLILRRKVVLAVGYGNIQLGSRHLRGSAKSAEWMQSS